MSNSSFITLFVVCVCVISSFLLTKKFTCLSLVQQLSLHTPVFQYLCSRIYSTLLALMWRIIFFFLTFLLRGEDDYMPGNIIEIELQNFMTFNHLKCKPGSRLNLVIGPNGSGKSSLVCAIALGLGGEPQVS